VPKTGTRGSSTTFAQRAEGDVFIFWESEAHLLVKAFGSWEKVGKEHFADGGIFDQIYARP
jgi:ABC-type sulfate transport system substrate-binding protein